MRYLLSQTYHMRLCVVKDFGCICFGIKKIYETHLTPNLILAKKLIFKNSFYIELHTKSPILFPKYFLKV